MTYQDYLKQQQQAIEHDIMYGRGASLYKKVERELAILRENAKVRRTSQQTLKLILKLGFKIVKDE